MAGSNGYTPTEAKMLAVLADFKDHQFRELQACLWDEMSGRSAVAYHISLLRGKLRKRGEEIATIRHSGCTFFRRVKLLVS